MNTKKIKDGASTAERFDWLPYDKYSFYEGILGKEVIENNDSHKLITGFHRKSEIIFINGEEYSFMEAFEKFKYPDGKLFGRLEGEE